MKNTKFVALALLSVACLSGAASAATPAQKGFVTGTVVNEQGKPLPGVEIDVDNTLSYDSSLITYTDAQGRYKVDVRKLPFTFQVYAKMKLKYGDFTVNVELVPNNPDAVAGVAGGVRDFVFSPSLAGRGAGVWQVRSRRGRDCQVVRNSGAARKFSKSVF